MAESWGNVSRQRLMETIVVLWTLTEVPGGSNIHTHTCLPPENQATRQLTFEREKNLVEILAFLSGTTDDPSKVMAVCIEEGSAGDSVIIRLASNSGDCSNVLSGFQSIAIILEQSSRREKEKEVANQDLLREIVRLDFWRILSRLRSKHAKRSPKTIDKQALIKQLSNAVHSPLRQRGNKLSAEKVSGLKNKVQSLQQSVSTLEDISNVDDGQGKAEDILMDIVKWFSEVANDGILDPLLTKVGDLDPSLKAQKDYLLSAVGKLGRYCSASQDLIRAVRTKHHSVFNKISVEVCQLPPPPESYLVRTPSTLEKSIGNLIKGEPTLKNRGLPASVRQYLGNLYSAKSENFKLWTSNPRTSWKVHAEIQLLFFYEMHRADLPPRIICSSKSPCYLCHLFFSLHAQFRVPETHGRLYPGWILPTWLEQLSEKRRANVGRTINALHTTLVLQIKHLVTNKRVPVRPPNESVLWAPANWSASSVQSSLTKNSLEVPIAPHQEPQELAAIDGNSKAYTISAKHQDSPPSPSSQDPIRVPVVDRIPLPCHPSESSLGLTAAILYFLNPGEFANIQLADATAELRISTRRLNLTFTRDSVYDDGVLETCWIRCSLLDNSALPGANITHQSVNIMNITPGSEVTFETGSVYATSDLLIVACDEVLSIKYSAKETVGTLGMSLDGTAPVT